MFIAGIGAAGTMLKHDDRQPTRSALGKSQLTGDCDRFAVLVTGQELLIRQGERFDGASLRSLRQIFQARIGHRGLSPCETQKYPSCLEDACHRTLLLVRCRPHSAAAATVK